MSTEQFPWLEGVTNWWESTPVAGALDEVDDYATDMASRIAASYFQPAEQRIPGQLDAAATVGQNAANLAASGFLALPRLQQGLPAYTEAVQSAQERFGRTPSTPMGQYYINTLEAAAAPIEALKEELGERGLPYGPEAATAGYMLPDLAAALTGTGFYRGAKPRQFRADDLFPEKPRIEGPLARGPINQMDPTGRQRGSVKVTDVDPDTGVEQYGSIETKTPARTPLFDFPEMDVGTTFDVTPNAPVSKPAGEALFSSVVPAAMRETNMQSGTPEQWKNHFKRYGVNEKELFLTGLGPMLDNAQGKVSRDEIKNAYSEASQVGTGEVWAAGHDVAEDTQGMTSEERMQKKMEVDNRIAEIRGELGTTPPDARARDVLRNESGMDSYYESFPAMDALSRGLVQDVLQGVGLDWEFYDTDNSGWVDVRTDNNWADRLANHLRAKGVGDQAVIDATIERVQGTIDRIQDVEDITPEQRAELEREHEQLTQDRRKYMKPSGPAGQTDPGYLGEYSYPTRLGSQVWHYQVPDVYGQAEAPSVPAKMHYKEPFVFGKDPDYNYGNTTTNIGTTRASIRPVMSEATWTDPATGDTMRATSVDVNESQYDPLQYAEQGQQYHGFEGGFRRPREAADEGRAKIAADKYSEQMGLANDLSTRQGDIGNEISSIINKPGQEGAGRQLARQYESAFDNAMQFVDIGDYDGEKNAADAAKRDILEALDGYLGERLAAERTSNIPLTPFMEEMKKLPELYSRHKKANVSEKKMRKGAMEQKGAKEFYEDPESAFTHEMTPLLGERGARMNPPLAMSMQKAMDEGHEFITWATQRAAGQAYSRAGGMFDGYGKTGPEAEVYNRKSRDVRYEPDKGFYDAGTNALFPEESVPEDYAQQMRSDPWRYEFPESDTPEGREKLIEANYQGNWADIDRIMTSGNDPRIKQSTWIDPENTQKLIDAGIAVPEDLVGGMASARKVRVSIAERANRETSDPDNETALHRQLLAQAQDILGMPLSEVPISHIDAATGIHYPGYDSRYEVARDAYYAENPDEIKSYEELVQSNAIDKIDYQRGTQKRITPNLNERMPNPDRGVLQEIGGVYKPEGPIREDYQKMFPENPTRGTFGLKNPNSLATRGMAERWYDREFVQLNMRRFLRNLGLNEKQINEAVTDVDIGIDDPQFPGRRQNVPSIRMTDDVKAAWENRPAGGLFGGFKQREYKPSGETKPNK